MRRPRRWSVDEFTLLEKYPDPPETWWCPMCGRVSIECKGVSTPDPVCICLIESHKVIIPMKRKFEGVGR